MSDDLLADAHEPQLVLPSAGDVVCFGFLTYCLLLVVETLPAKNAGAPILETVGTFGDDAAIVACLLSGWGVPATLISSPVGDDYYGTKVIEQLGARGIDVDERVTEGLTTPLEVGIVDASGARTYFQRRDPLILDSLTAARTNQLSGARMLYADWYDAPGALAAMEIARCQDVPVFLNLESQYENNPKLPELLRYANICQVSMDEPEASGDPFEVARALIDQGVGTVLVTLGADGCVVAQPNQAFYLRAPKVKVVDGYGAGAAFSAGMIYGLLSGWSLDRSARFATAHAGLKCGVIGPPAFPITQVQTAAADLDVRPLVL